MAAEIRHCIAEGIVLLGRAVKNLLGGTRGCCRFEPSCSVYVHSAILIHGVPRGCMLAILRIARCGPWSRGGFDPVPHCRRELT